MTFEEAKKRIKELDSGSSFGGSDYESGWEDALRRVTEVLDEIDTEPVGNPDKLTLRELARELRQKCNFKYMTAESGIGDCSTAHLWSDKPYYDVAKTWVCTKGRMYGWLASDVFSFTLDLSEYADENGNIDYSKCIVEVTDDIN